MKMLNLKKLLIMLGLVMVFVIVSGCASYSHTSPVYGTTTVINDGVVTQVASVEHEKTKGWSFLTFTKMDGLNSEVTRDGPNYSRKVGLDSFMSDVSTNAAPLIESLSKGMMEGAISALNPAPDVP